MYYYNNNNDNNQNDNQQKDNNSNDNDDPYLSHSLDSMFQAQQNQQDWTENTLASYLSMGLQSHSLDSPFFNDAFGQFPQTTSTTNPTATATNTGDWDIFGQPSQTNLHDTHATPHLNQFHDDNDFFKLQNDELFLNEQAQQAILLSDPNFVRQQQLLQEQQKQMELRMKQEEQQQEETNESMSTTSIGLMSSSAPVRSNLSAMFGHATAQNQQPSVQQAAADTTSVATSAAATAAAAAAAATAAATIRAKKSSAIKKETPNRRSSSSTASSASTSNKRNTNPIPISSSSSSNEVDHQRRLNELQARFRVNYARKPNQRKQQQQQQAQQQSASAMTQSFEPSSLPNFSSNHHAQAALERRRSTSIAVDPPQRQQPTMRIGRMSRAPAVTTSKSSAPTLTRTPVATATPSSTSSSTPSTNTSTTASSASITTTTTAAAIGNTSSSTGNQTQTTAPFPSRTMPIQIQRVQRPNASLQLDKEQRQRKLDEQLEKVDFDDITVSELKEMLRQRGRRATGKKAVLVQRLLDERELIKAIKSGRIPPHQRHSLPAVDIPSTMASDTTQQHASSVPTVSGFPAPPPGPGSPGSTLNRSIANMHIGSPPVPHSAIPPPPSNSRRFAPYSPTTRTTGSPKQQNQQPLYSSSMPTNNYLTPMDETPRTPRYPRHKYAPRTPSALATPDHEEELNPFEQFIMMHNQQQQQQQQMQQQPQQQPQRISPEEQMQQEDVSRMMDMEWDSSINIDPNFSQQDGGVDMSKLTQEELIQLFTGTADMTLDNTFLR